MNAARCRDVAVFVAQRGVGSNCELMRSICAAIVAAVGANVGPAVERSVRGQRAVPRIQDLEAIVIHGVERERVCHTEVHPADDMSLGGAAQVAAAGVVGHLAAIDGPGCLRLIFTTRTERYGHGQLVDARGSRWGESGLAGRRCQTHRWHITFHCGRSNR